MGRSSSVRLDMNSTCSLVPRSGLKNPDVLNISICNALIV